jgi:hypothetical protein
MNFEWINGKTNLQYYFNLNGVFVDMNICVGCKNLLQCNYVVCSRFELYLACMFEGDVFARRMLLRVQTVHI